MSRLAVYKGGSSLLLKKSRDTDLIYFYETCYEAQQERYKYNRIGDIDIHFLKAIKPRISLWCCLYHFMELIEGENLHLDKFSIFDHKDEYIECLKVNITMPKANKSWYHILTAIYMFENNSYTLTEKQLEDIQQTHDNGISEELYQHIVKYLTEAL